MSRRFGGVQQIKAAIDFHTYGELVLWPPGYTFADTAPGLDADQHAASSPSGRAWPRPTATRPQQASDLYITDGAIDDWLWGAEGVFAYTFEMYPTTASPGFYPPDEVIAAQTVTQPRGGPAAAGDRRLPVPRDRQAGGRTAPPPSRPRHRRRPIRRPASAPPPPPAPARRALASALASRAGVGADGRVRLRIDCRTTAPTRCRGTLTLKARLPGGRGRTTTIARVAYSVAAGRRTLTLRLRLPARRALRTRATLAATATLATRQAGGSTTARSRRVVLVRRR